LWSLLDQGGKLAHIGEDVYLHHRSGLVVFPSNRVDGKPTINAARGFNRKISDRMHLTLDLVSSRRCPRAGSLPFRQE
jgi:hypothetical protein